jgi:hypothetical protein
LLQINEKFAAPNARQKTGWLVVRSRWLPRSLGQVLMVGGVGDVLSTFVSYVFADADLVAGLLTVPATIGELWTVGHLILFVVREHARIV